MSLTEASGAGGTTSSKQAACLECHRSKIKCLRDSDSTICKRCQANGSECVIREYHVGRYKGVKNKRTGLEKAIYQVEQAIKRSKSNGVSFDADADVDLRQLIGQSQQIAKDARGGSSDYGIANPSRSVELMIPKPSAAVQQFQHTMADDRADSRDGYPDLAEKPDELALDNAENPLQLLAMASALPNQSPSVAITPSSVAGASRSDSLGVEADDADLQQFFGSLTIVLDNSQEVDPIDMGLVTNEEADSLFKYFYEHLSHTRWGLDPVLHTASFVRSRSAFLFTSILTSSATFMSNTAALAKRLSTHRDYLAQRVMVNRYRSVEIVLAFIINIPWMSPGRHWADDQTCAFLSAALTLALDLQLNKIVVPSQTIRSAGFLDRVAKSECIDATKALQLDGFEQIDPMSAWGRRLVRTRERVWLALFVLDRGVCLARGRPYAVPKGPLVESCDSWHVSDIADRWDGSIISTAVLRRDLVPLIASVREACDNSQLSVMGGSQVVKFLKDKIDRFFDAWYAIWSFQSTQGDGNLPPYVEILVSHTKLSTYCSVINHPTAPSDVKQFFRAAGLASALNVMRAVVQGEGRLKSMPNNSVIMVSFAACFALGLSITTQGDRAVLAPNAKLLIEQTAEVLERIGTTPKHRHGASALFGRHIRWIMRTSFPSSGAPAPFSSPSAQLPGNLDQAQIQSAQMVPRVPNADAYTFDMTDDQIIEAISNASQSQELFQLDESMFLDWLEWPNTT